jgi:hypothetical protein
LHAQNNYFIGDFKVRTQPSVALTFPRRTKQKGYIIGHGPASISDENKKENSICPMLSGQQGPLSILYTLQRTTESCMISFSSDHFFTTWVLASKEKWRKERKRKRARISALARIDKTKLTRKDFESRCRHRVSALKGKSLSFPSEHNIISPNLGMTIWTPGTGEFMDRDERLRLLRASRVESPLCGNEKTVCGSVASGHGIPAFDERTVKAWD